VCQEEGPLAFHSSAEKLTATWPTMNPSPLQYFSNHSTAPNRAFPNSSQNDSSQSPQSLSNDAGRPYELRYGSDSHSQDIQPYESLITSPPMSHTIGQSGTKRKRSASSSSRVLKKEERKKVSRACDTCKSWVTPLYYLRVLRTLMSIQAEAPLHGHATMQSM